MGVNKNALEDLRSLKDKFAALSEKGKDEFMDYACKQIAGRFLSYVIPDTPVITGRLRRGWIGLDSEGSTPQAAEIQKYTETKMPIVRKPGKCSATITNNVHYAPYVEYGHRTYPGKKIGKTEVPQYWVDGQFMMHRAIKNTEKIAEPLVRKLWAQFMDSYFEG